MAAGSSGRLTMVADPFGVPAGEAAGEDVQVDHGADLLATQRLEKLRTRQP